MALGAITLEPVMVGGSSSDPGVLYLENGLRLVIANIVGDSSYPTGGSVITPAALGLPNGVVVPLGVNLAASSGSNNDADSATLQVSNGGTSLKLQCWAQTDAAGCPIAEVANAVNLSGLTWTVIALGW